MWMVHNKTEINSHSRNSLSLVWLMQVSLGYGDSVQKKRSWNWCHTPFWRGFFVHICMGERLICPGNKHWKPILPVKRNLNSQTVNIPLNLYYRWTAGRWETSSNLRQAPTAKIRKAFSGMKEGTEARWPQIPSRHLQFPRCFTQTVLRCVIGHQWSQIHTQLKATHGFLSSKELGSKLSDGYHS